MLASITGSVDQELPLRDDGLVTEYRIVRDSMKGRLCLAAWGRRLPRVS